MTRRFAISMFAIAFLGPCDLTAQTRYVFPSDHQTIEGSTYSSDNPLSAGVARFQLIYSSWDLHMTHGAHITRVGFRADMAANAQGKSIQLEILMGETDRLLDYSAGGLSSTFANNYINPPVTVFTRRIVALPNLTPETTGPSSQIVFFTLDNPWTFHSNHNLVVDFFVTANNNGNTGFTYPLDVPTYTSTTTRFGTSCTTSTSQVPVLTSTTGAQLGGYWSLSVSQSLPNAPGLMLLGTNNTNSGGIPLPYSLGPHGAPGCSWLVEYLALLPAGTSPSGSYGVYIPIPRVLDYYGTNLYAQHWIADVFANNLGLVTSNGVRSSIGSLPQAAYVRTYNNTTQTTGSLTIEQCITTVFELQ